MTVQAFCEDAIMPRIQQAMHKHGLSAYLMLVAIRLIDAPEPLTDDNAVEIVVSSAHGPRFVW
jgi:hypothetical protein